MSEKIKSANRRLTLTVREMYLMREILAYLTSTATSMNAEGECLLKLARNELLVLRNRLSE